MIAFITTNTITCGGMIVPFEYISRLKKLGHDARMYAEEGNKELEDFYGVEALPLSTLETSEDDVIIATRWEQCEMLSTYKGRKYQFVQGDDLLLLGDDVARGMCSRERNNPEWSLIGVSRYCLMRWNRGEVIPNGVNERFFESLGVDKDIDILIEGNNEPNKNIPEAIWIADKVETYLDQKLKIVWLGRETDDRLGVECITNPRQEEIPAIYQRAKTFIKLSTSEGFCLPILEAMASKCLVATRNMGGNDAWCDETNCIMDDYFKQLGDHIRSGEHKWIVEKGYQTARNFTWDKSIEKLIKTVGV